MLLSFTVENYRSIKQSVTLSLEPLLPKTKKKENIILGDRYSALKSIVLYGANSSGKSNIFKAIKLFRAIVLLSAKESQAGEHIKIEPFKLSSVDKQASNFECEFLDEGIRYRYGFSANQEKIISEWCFVAEKVKEYPLFLRTEQIFDVRSRFKEGKDLESKTRPNALFLSVTAQWNGEISNKILNKIRGFKLISGLDDIDYFQYTVHQLNDPIKRKKILQMLEAADIDISDIEVNEIEVTPENLPPTMPNEIKNLLLKGGKSISLRTKHNKYDDSNNVVGSTYLDFNNNESEGTKKFFSLTGPLLDVLTNGYTLIVDELDARLHPLLTKTIVRLFNSDEINTKGAQLIFATHDTTLLSSLTLRRDQIWFCEKNWGESTDLYCLAEYKLPDGKGKPREDAIWSKEYINGRYGAIPYLGNFFELFKE